MQIERCGELGSAPRVPSGAAIASYRVVERHGMIWVFVGDRVYYELPTDEELFPGRAWRRVGHGDVGEIRTGCRDIMENGIDCAHFEPVHNIRVKSAEMVETTENRLRFQVAISAALDEIVAGGKAAQLLKRFGINAFFDGVVHGTIYGPSLLFVHIDLDSRFYVPLRFATMLSPAAPRCTRQFYAAYAPSDRYAPWSLAVARLFTAKLRHNLLSDKRMWDDKLDSDACVLCDADILPIMRYRKWWDGLARAARPEARAASI
jgi:hypothetical protein